MSWRRACARSIRQSKGEADPTLRIGALELDPAAHKVVHAGEPCMKPREFALLHKLMLNTAAC